MDDETPLEIELHGYVDGALDDEAMARIEEHLRRNPDIAAKVGHYLQQKNDIRAFARLGTSTAASAAVEKLERHLARRLKRKTFFLWRRASLVAMLLAAGWLGHAIYAPLAEGPAYADDIVQAHILASNDPSEVLPISPDRISRLFSRLGEIQHLPDLRQLGFQPIGAQLLPSDEGAVLHVPYRNDSGTIVSYFLLHDNEESNVPLHVLHRNGVTMAYWQNAHSRYAFTAPLTEEQLSQIASFAVTAPDIY